VLWSGQSLNTVVGSRGSARASWTPIKRLLRILNEKYYINYYKYNSVIKIVVKGLKFRESHILKILSQIVY
jgi:hypothetical protein